MGTLNHNEKKPALIADILKINEKPLLIIPKVVRMNMYAQAKARMPKTNPINQDMLNIMAIENPKSRLAP